MSDAVYNEVISLVAQTENFERQIQEANAIFATLADTVANPLELSLNATDYIASIDKMIQHEKTYRAQIEATNKILQERRALAEDKPTSSQFLSAPEKANLLTSADTELAKQAATRELSKELSRLEGVEREAKARQLREIELQSVHMIGEATRRNDADRLARQQAARDAELAALKADIIARDKATVDAFTNSVHNEDQLKQAEKVRIEREDARIRAEETARKRRELDDTHNAQQLAKIKTDAAADLATKSAKQVAIDKANLSSKLHQEEAAATIANKMSQYRMSNELSVAIEIAERRKIIAEFEAEETRRRLALEKQVAATKSTVGYKVGSTIAGGKVGAGFDIAAGGAFALGATNLGGTVYMAERAAYALGIGQKTLGEFAEKLGLVKLTGDGAEASIARFGKGVIGLGAVLTAAAATIGVITAGRKLDSALAEMSTLLADTTVQGKKFDDMLQSVSASAARLSSEFDVDIVEVVKGFKTALSTGIDAKDLEAFGRSAMTVARGLGTSFEDATSILTTFKDAYGTSIMEMAHFSDVLFNAINVGKFQVNDLKANIGRVLTSASEAGVGVEDMMGSLATLTRVGMTTSQAITSLNSLIVGITNPTATAAKEFHRLGLATGSAALSTSTLLEYLTQLRAATAGNKDVIGELFGEERARRGAIGLTSNIDLAHKVTAEMDKVGTATIAASRAMDTFGENVSKAFKKVWNEVQRRGETLLNVLNTIIFKSETVPEAMNNLTVKSVDMSTKVVDNTKAITDAYNDLTDAITAAGTAGESAFDKLMRKQHDYFKMYVRAKAEAGYTGPTGTPADQTADEKAAREQRTALARSRGAAELELDPSTMKYSPIGLSDLDRYQKSLREQIALIDAQSAAVDAQIDRFVAARNEVSKTRRAIADEQRELAVLAEMEAAGIDVSEEKATVNARKATREAAADPERTKEIEKQAEQSAYTRKATVDALEYEFDAFRKLMLVKQDYAKITTSTSREELNAQETNIDALRAKYDAVNKLINMTGVLSASQVTHYTKMADAYLKEIDATQEKIDTQRDVLTKKDIDAIEKVKRATAERYKREYEVAEAAYAKKMALYNAEEKRIKNIIEKQQELIRELRQSASDRTSAIRGPEYQRRAYKDQIEQGVKTVSNIKDAEQQIKAVEELRKVVEKFVTASEASGNGKRGEREAADIEVAIAAILAKAEAKREAELRNIEGLKQVAGQVRNQAEATNPVANAIRSEAQKVIKETLSEAAKYGMTISGDYKVDIDKVNVSVEGLQKSEVQRMIETAVTAGMRNEIKKRTNSDVGYENGIAPAGVGTGSTWNDSKGTWE